MKIAANEKLFRMTRQLWREAFCHYGESLEEMISSRDKNGIDDSFKWHPFGKFDCERGYMVSGLNSSALMLNHMLIACFFNVIYCYKYIDRIGFRIQTKLAESLGKDMANDNLQVHETSIKKQSKNRTKARPIQRSLTPHFDCCPETYHEANKDKWRPIQCFVSLTDSLHPNTGGFEAVPGFHREFHEWTMRGRRCTDQYDEQPHPRPCLGEYTHINPTYDREILQRVQHIPVRAGHAVFWDNRIPHGNAYTNDPVDSNENVQVGDEISEILNRSGARAVVYCSFLPDVYINRSFVSRQLGDWKLGHAPRCGDRWIKREENTKTNVSTNKKISDNITSQLEAQLTDLGKKLIGLTEW